MKYKTKIIAYYFQKTGVYISTIFTIVNFLLLTGALICKDLEIRKFESLAIFALILEFCYGTTLTFLILRHRNTYLHLTPFLITNWFIGCFNLNSFFPVFMNLPIWVYITTLIFCISNFFLYRKTQETPRLAIFFFLNGITFWIVLYFTLYLLPLIPYSMLGILALGLGFYGLIPIIVTIIHLTTIVRYLPENKTHNISFAVGFSFVLIVLIFFTVGLANESRKISETTVTNSFEKKEDLPTYISVSQSLKPNFFNEIVLKKGIVYLELDNLFSFSGFDSFGTKQFNEEKIHNPFISIAYLFCKDPGLSKNDKINILQSNFDKRFETEEQLWSGENLFTKNIKEDVKIYPDIRLAYTEITMNIACTPDTWQNQEAIYSFQLPEGSVATSLSLWVNGIERKGVLTTKEKAKSAYN